MAFEELGRDDDYDKYFFDGLTMKNNNASGEYYFYSSISGVSINIFECYYDRIGSRDSNMNSWRIENIELTAGWNSLELN